MFQNTCVSGDVSATTIQRIIGVGGVSGTRGGSGRHSVERIQILRTSGHRRNRVGGIATLRLVHSLHLHLIVMDPQIGRIIRFAQLSFDVALDVALLGTIR